MPRGGERCGGQPATAVARRHWAARPGWGREGDTARRLVADRSVGWVPSDRRRVLLMLQYLRFFVSVACD